MTLVTRDLKKTREHFPDIDAVETDFATVEALASVLTPGNFVSLVILTKRDQLKAQMMLVDAAVEVGIPHVIPSAFGIGPTNPEVRKWPVLSLKAQIEDHLQKVAEGGRLVYTAINTGMFLDYAVERGVLFSLDTKKPTALLDGGDKPLSTTTMDDIGIAVATAVLKREHLKNRTLFIHTAVVTQNQLLQYARVLHPDREFKSLHLDTKEMVQKAEERLSRGETGPDVAMPYMARASFGLGLGIFKQVDNEVLGIELWNEQQVRQLVADALLAKE